MIAAAIGKGRLSIQEHRLGQAIQEGKDVMGQETVTTIAMTL